MHMVDALLQHGLLTFEGFRTEPPLILRKQDLPLAVPRTREPVLSEKSTGLSECAYHNL